MGWYSSIDDEDKQKFHTYSGCDKDDIHWQMIRMAMASVADIAVTPLQDVLGLGNEARMNVPGTATGNWQWRFKDGDLLTEYAGKLKLYCRLYNR